MTTDTATATCAATMRALYDPDHTHTCVGRHGGICDHYCGDCDRWWGSK